MTSCLKPMQREQEIVYAFNNQYQQPDPFWQGKVMSYLVPTEDISGKPSPELEYKCKPTFLDYVDVQLMQDILLGSIDKFAQANGPEKEVFFYHGDHLGSANWITDGGGKPIQYIHYAPYGELIENQHASWYDERYKFTGKERDAETGYDYFGARYLWSDAGHWLSVDRFADKYPQISPYAHSGWNPVRNIDIHGDSISFYLAELFDKKAKTNVVGNTLNDLQAITGLTLCLNNGMLEYSKNEDGSAIVSHNKGSETARNHLISLIDNPQTINVGVGKKSIGNGNDIKLAPKQINAFISGARGVDSRTLGYGMTLLHESFHTDIGGSLKDNLYSTGPVVDRMNVIRQELGPTWGQRMSYMSLSSHGKSYIPFNQSAYEALNAGLLPCALFGQLFISY